VVAELMKLRFPINDIPKYSLKNQESMSQRDRRLTDEITKNIFPAYRARGHLTKNEFLTVCSWKTPRTHHHCAKNDSSAIEDISALVWTTKSEALRIQAWTLLSGVNWPTASVFLHFAFKDLYPIFDFRALWSLGVEKPPTYTLEFWNEYTATCRGIAAKVSVSLRDLDRALWKYSDLNQR
jgi:hypothetical protein